MYSSVTVAVCAWLCVCACAPRAAGAASEWGEGPRCVDKHCRQKVDNEGSRDPGKWPKETFFLLEGRFIESSWDTDFSFTLYCGGWAALDSPALPSFPSEYRVPYVELQSCPPPAAGRSYVQALAAINVSLIGTGTLSGRNGLSLLSLPSYSALDAPHFTGLEHLSTLRVEASDQTHPAPRLLVGSLTKLQNLRRLAVHNVRLDYEALTHLPDSLRRLALVRVNVAPVPPSVFALPELLHLEIDQDEKISLDENMVSYLASLKVSASCVSLRAVKIPELQILRLTNWVESRPPALVQCYKLGSLELVSPAMESLPSGWLVKCPHLRIIVIRGALSLTELPPRMLGNATAFEVLMMTEGVLEVLPPRLFDDAPNLTKLVIRQNHLKTLPSELFKVTGHLEVLDLSRNRFVAEGLRPLEPLTRLAVLNLSHNPDLTDLCAANGSSVIRKSTGLRRLYLNGTGVTRICRDWREDMTRLTELHLSNTNITYLAYADLQYESDAVRVTLQGAPITSVRFDREDYERETATPTKIVLSMNFETVRFKCNCLMYWTWIALRQNANSDLSRLDWYCDTGVLLKDVASPDELVCDEPEACDSGGCACSARPDVHCGRLVFVRCRGAALLAVPPALSRINDTVDLLLADNRIAHLRDADLPPNFRVLDLRNNALVSLDVQTAETLVRKSRTLYLSGNPLDCNCSAAPILRTLSHNFKAVPDYGITTCADGTALEDAPLIPCTSNDQEPLVIAISVSSVLVFATLTIAAYFTRREPRLACAAILRRWGLRTRARDEAADGRPFDAFVTFSHEDEEFVRELVARLESGPTPYRLCLHYRDWVPGRMIPEQISESVRSSRRTVALVSRHFLRSTWARAEFREAHAHALRDATPRLVVVLLEEPASLPFDTELRHYLAINTYVRWGEPWFWEKLQNALPNPRPPDSPRSASSPNAGTSARDGFPENFLNPGPRISIPTDTIELRSMTSS